MTVMAYPDTPYPDEDGKRPSIDELLSRAQLISPREDRTPEQVEEDNRKSMERLVQRRAEDEAWLASLSPAERAAEERRREDDWARVKQEAEEGFVLDELEVEVYDHVWTLPDGARLVAAIARWPRRGH